MLAAINLAADFVNVEPTSFAAVQESGLLEAFYSAIEEHIEPSLDVRRGLADLFSLGLSLTLTLDWNPQRSSMPSRKRSDRSASRSKG